MTDLAQRSSIRSTSPSTQRGRMREHLDDVVSDARGLLAIGPFSTRPPNSRRGCSTWRRWLPGRRCRRYGRRCRVNAATSTGRHPFRTRRPYRNDRPRCDPVVSEAAVYLVTPGRGGSSTKTARFRRNRSEVIVFRRDFRGQEPRPVHTGTVASPHPTRKDDGSNPIQILAQPTDPTSDEFLRPMKRAAFHGPSPPR